MSRSDNGFHVRRFRAHSRNCYARKHAQTGDWGTAWAVGCQPTEMQRDLFTTKHPVTGKALRHTWVLIRCNDTDCPASSGNVVGEDLPKP